MHPTLGPTSSINAKTMEVPNMSSLGPGTNVVPGIAMAPMVPQSNIANGHVMLKDVIELVRMNLVGVPSGFTKLGYPIMYFPDSSSRSFPTVLESDLHLLFKYYLSVVPRTEQGTGFALIIDRSAGMDWTYVRNVFHRVITLFPARIREVYLIHRDGDQPPRSRQSSSSNGSTASSNSSKDIVHQLMDEFLLDFDIFQIDDPADLLHYIDAKCLPRDLGGQVNGDIENWLVLQEHVEGFSYNARRIARRLAQFVGLLNQEDINYRGEALREIAAKNRGNYRKLRKELEDLTDHGLLMLKSLQRPDANVMQRLAVQVLCKQLDQAWTYFSRSWKMQDHVYVQYLELNTFQQRYRELANTFAENDRMVRELPISGSSTEEVNAALDKIDSVTQSVSIAMTKARELTKLGQDLMNAHNFATDCVQPKITELKMICQKLELMLNEKRRLLHKFLDLMDCLDLVAKWCTTATDHLDLRDLNQSHRIEPNGSGPDEDVFSQIRQIDYLLSKSQELKLRSRQDFEESFDEIKNFMSAQTLFAVDDSLERLDAVTYRVMQRREELRSKAMRTDRKFSLSEHDPNESMKIRRENILAELLATESKYVSDLEEILIHYRDKLEVSNLTETRQKAQIIFGNLDEIHEFHSTAFHPELERCGVNPSGVARTILANCHEVKILYSHYCQNMSASRQAIQDLGGEQTPSSILVHCQQEAGHQLPLSSYLLKPMQRLTKYQLLIKDLTESSNVVCGKPELEEALAELLSVIKVVNDSMHDITIKGLPNAVKPLGTLNNHETFQVTSENKGQSQILFSRNKSQRRHVFLYDNHVVFCKAINEKNQTYHFKFSLGTSSLGMSSIVKGEEKKIELWVHGRNELYTLEAKTKKIKDDFGTDLRKVIIRQKEHRGHRGQPQIFYDTASTTTASTESGEHHARSSKSSRLTRSRSLESGRANAPLRSRSLDCAGDRSSPEMDGNGSKHYEHGGRYMVLADYMALTGREIDLTEDEIVELVKVGCAGWWYVRLSAYPYPEGWAPSTYLEKVPND